MKNSTSIFILGPSLNLFFLRLMVIFQRPKEFYTIHLYQKTCQKKIMKNSVGINMTQI